MLRIRLELVDKSRYRYLVANAPGKNPAVCRDSNRLLPGWHVEVCVRVRACELVYARLCLCSVRVCGLLCVLCSVLCSVRYAECAVCGLAVCDALYIVSCVCTRTTSTCHNRLG